MDSLFSTASADQPGEPLLADRAAELDRVFVDVARSFAFHPCVSLLEASGEPVSRYRFLLRVRTMGLDSWKQLETRDSIEVEITLPGTWAGSGPLEGVLIRICSPVFHPNVADEMLRISAPGRMESVVELVKEIGEVLAGRRLDRGTVVNSAAMNWWDQNRPILPWDNRARFDPAAGGQPALKIEQFGPIALQALRMSIEELLPALAEPASPETSAELTPAHLRKFSRQARQAIRIFLDESVSEPLRTEARKLDQLAQLLPQTSDLFARIASRKEMANEIESETERLRQKLAELLTEIARFTQLVPRPIDSAKTALTALPSSSALAPFLARLPSLFNEVVSLGESLRAKLQTSDVDGPGEAFSGVGSDLLEAALSRQSEAAKGELERVIPAANGVLAQLEIETPGARAEVLSLRVLARWRDFFDTFAAALSLEQRVIQTNLSLLESYMIDGPMGRIGPIDFEQEVDLGSITLLATRGLGASLEVREAESDAKIAREPGQTVTVMLPPDKSAHVAQSKSAGATGVAVTFSCIEPAENIASQLAEAVAKTSDLLPKLQSVGYSEAQSWCGTMLNYFATDVADMARMREEHRRAVHRWEALASELEQLASFKARWSTYLLLTRISRVSESLLAQQQSGRERSALASQRLASITARSTRGPDGALMIPAKFAQSFNDETEALRQSKKKLARMKTRLDRITLRLRERLASPKQCGRAVVPGLRRLASADPQWIEMASLASDDSIEAMVAHLSAVLNVSLLVNLPREAGPASTPSVTDSPASPDTASATEGQRSEESSNDALDLSRDSSDAPVISEASWPGGEGLLAEPEEQVQSPTGLDFASAEEKEHNSASGQTAEGFATWDGAQTSGEDGQAAQTSEE